jgi:hypothetical protein
MREIVVAALLLLNATVADVAPLSTRQVEQYIRAAQNETPSFKDVPADLANSRSFIILWKRSDEASRHARPLLSESKLKADDKVVLAWALQNLRWPELIELYEWGFDSYTKGNLSSELVEELIFPGWDWNPPSLKAVFIRTLCRSIPFEAFSIFGAKAICWHDRFSDTRVLDLRKAADFRAGRLAGVNAPQVVDPQKPDNWGDMSEAQKAIWEMQQQQKR